MENQKMIKIAATLDKLSGILGGIALVCGFVCIVFVILVLLLGERVFLPGSNVLELDWLALSLSEEYQAVTPAVRSYTVVSLIEASLSCFIIYYILKYMRCVLLSVKAGLPFEKDVPVSFRRMGMVTLVGGLVSELFDWGQQLLMLRAYPLEEIFASPAISGIKVHYVMDMSFVVIALVFFLLSWVFRYGYELQKQSDEVL